MKTLNKLIIILLLVIRALPIAAQDSFYNYVEMGDYDVGFADSVIFDEEASYDQLGYNGPLPIFVKIWYPAKNTSQNAFMTFSDFQRNSYEGQLSDVYEYMNAQIDTFFVSSYFQTYKIQGEYDIEHTPTDFGKSSNAEALKIIKSLKTRSIAAPIKTTLDFPVIVYHHGAQSSAEESFFLAEFFASKGYIVVSAAFQLPYEGKMYGFEPEKFDDTVPPKKVIEFARKISSNSNIYFIGHSAGAQVGFRFLYEPGWASGFISLETSTEFWRRSSIKKGWKSLYKAVSSHRKDYQLPILMVANTADLINPFPLFDEIENAPMTHASSKVYFDHESYTSVYHMRYFFRDQIHQKDTDQSKAQLDLYIEHLKLIDGFISSLQTGSQLEIDKFSDYFFFTQFNYE